MAYKTLVNNAFVRQLSGFVRHATEQKGGFALVMLLPSESGVRDMWNLVLSAPWIDKGGLKATIPDITSLLRKSLSRTNAGKIERVSVLPTSDRFVTGLAWLDILPGEAYQVYTTELAEKGLSGAIVLVAPSSGNAGYRQLHSVQAE